MDVSVLRCVEGGTLLGPLERADFNSVTDVSSKGPNTVDAFILSPEIGSSFWNVVFSSHSEIWMIDKVQKYSNSDENK
jgi:hypothetical protein